MTASAIDESKQAVRERVWALLQRENVAVPAGRAHGHIPNFVGADAAAGRLAELEPWQRAQVVKANPDWAQLPVRVRALEAGKLLYMAVPRLATIKPFYLLDPADASAPYEKLADPKGAAQHVRTVGVDEMRPVDLVVCGSVAVNRRGMRVGKGAGYSDIEVALLIEAGLIGPGTTIVTTVHHLQVLDEELPETAHDFSVDVIVTPDSVIRCPASRRPDGLTLIAPHRKTSAAIPALKRLFSKGDEHRAGPEHPDQRPS